MPQMFKDILLNILQSGSARKNSFQNHCKGRGDRIWQNDNMVKAEQTHTEDCLLLSLTVHRFFCPLAVIIQETFLL